MIFDVLDIAGGVPADLANQQPGGSPTHLPRRRTRGLRADKFSGASRPQVEPLGATAGRADVA